MTQDISLDNMRYVMGGLWCSLAQIMNIWGNFDPNTSPNTILKSKNGT